MVVIGQGTRALVGGEIVSQPDFLVATLPAAPCDGGAIAIERDDVPAADIKGVVTLCGGARRRAEVGEVSGCAGREILVIARSGMGNGFEPSPTGIIRAKKLGKQPGVILRVTKRKDGAVGALHEDVARLLLVAIGGVRRGAESTRDVARRRDDRIGCHKGGRRRGSRDRR